MFTRLRLRDSITTSYADPDPLGHRKCLCHLLRPACAANAGGKSGARQRAALRLASPRLSSRRVSSGGVGVGGVCVRRGAAARRIHRRACRARISSLEIDRRIVGRLSRSSYRTVICAGLLIGSSGRSAPPRRSPPARAGAPACAALRGAQAARTENSSYGRTSWPGWRTPSWAMTGMHPAVMASSRRVPLGRGWVGWERRGGEAGVGGACGLGGRREGVRAWGAVGRDTTRSPPGRGRRRSGASTPRSPGLGPPRRTRGGACRGTGA